jgi:hypothetical protein
MSDNSTDKKNITTKLMNYMANLKESTIILILVIVIFIIILLTLLYYFYMRNLQSKECNSMDALYSKLNGKIRSINAADPDCGYLFRDYYIKTAYNACSGGSYKNDFVNICVLKDLLKQGVRGLDFEIYSIDDNPVVATSTSDNYFIKETYNYMNFSDIMNLIRDYAFATGTAPNSSDPIIIHLRIKSENQKMYQNFAKLLKNYNTILLGKQYSYEDQGKNLGETKLLDLAGKVVIIVDRINNSFLECQEFLEYINMTSNSLFMRALNYYDIAYTPDMSELIEFNKKCMTIGMPNKGSNPENPSGIVLRETGTQMIAMRYQLFDTNLQENDIFFDLNGYAFVLKPENLRYRLVTIDAPNPQNPAVSYANRTLSSDYYKFDI